MAVHGRDGEPYNVDLEEGFRMMSRVEGSERRGRISA
jgi:hypothetical protein